MLEFILGVLCAAVTVVFWVLRRTYQHLPAKELKRLARRGDGAADLLYRAVGYGASLSALLTGGTVLFGALSLVAFASSTNVWWAMLLLLVIVGIGFFVFVPADELTRTSLWLARTAAPGIAWVLYRLHPVLRWLTGLGKRNGGLHVHTGLYEKEDLVELLERQKGQPDSRISDDEIALLQHALTFGDKLVSDVLVPMRVVRLADVSEPVGPILVDELNKTGHSRFPVYSGATSNIVGVLYLRDLVGKLKKGGTVGDVMSRKLNYVHEDFTLRQALQAFLKTRRHLFLVINNFEELVGILTLEDVLEQIVGKPIVDEFDKYDDMRAVAAAAAKREHAAHKKDKEEPAAEPEKSADDAPEPTEDGQEMVK